MDKYPFFAWESPNEINWKLTAASRLEATREYLVNSVASGILVPLVILPEAELVDWDDRFGDQGCMLIKIARANVSRLRI